MMSPQTNLPNQDCASQTALKWLDYICPFNVKHRILEFSDVQLLEIDANPKAKRQIDFEMGRYCAAGALEEFGESGRVAVGENREPVWPSGFIGAISHSDCRAWAGVSRSDELIALGVDTETVVEPSTRKQLSDEIASCDEWEVAEAFCFETGLSQETLFTLYFSAKESFYKAWASLTGHFFGFHDAAVDHIDAEKISISSTGRNPNYGHAPFSLDVFYLVNQQSVFTTTWISHDQV